jgi:glutamate-1-semialdehyde 2,1-aminomutase
MDGLRSAANRLNVPMIVQGFGPVFHTGFAQGGAFTDYRDWAKRADLKMVHVFVRLLQDRGVRPLSRGTWFVSAAHTQEDIASTLESAQDALAALKSRSPAA